MFGLRARVSEIEKLIDKTVSNIKTIIELLTLVKGKHFEYDSAFKTIMDMIAGAENHANARYIATQQKLALLEKIIRENNLDKNGILDTIIN